MLSVICNRHRRSALCGMADPHVHREHGMVYCSECFAEARRYAETWVSEWKIREIQAMMSEHKIRLQLRARR